MKNRMFSVAIDGPAGAGKSTVARRAAAEMGFVYVDTGAIYRAVALAVSEEHIDSADEAAVAALLKETSVRLQWSDDGLQHVFLNDTDVTDRIRAPEISEMASRVSALSAVREFLLETQREVAREHCVVMDGRDIGTVVLPDADVKIFLTASAEARADRRCKELQERGIAVSFAEVLREIETRDYRDMHRTVAPLCRAADAVVLDTSSLTLAQSVEETIRIIRRGIVK